MKPYGQQREASFGDPPGFEYYHQDYLEGRQSNVLGSGGLFFVVVLCAIPVIYQICFILDFNLLPIPELLWNVLVYLTPSRLLDAVEDYTNPLRIRNPALKGIPRTHAAKSEAMRRLLGLDTPGGIIGSVAQASRRRLSTLPMVNLGADGRPAGLGNWDNSCYQNSVLQGLASLDTMTGYLTSPTMEAEAMEETSRPELKMAEALRGLIFDLNDPENNGRRLWTPATLKNMSSWQQQDAQEYFSKVLDEIDKEVGRVAKLIRSSRGFESDASSNSSETAPLSTFRNPLEGLIAQRVGCTSCGYSEGLSMIPFNCLTVPLGRAWEYDITECLDEYTKLEQIDGVECGKCTLLKNQRLLSTLLERSMDPDSQMHQQATERLAAVELALEDDDYEDKTLLQKCKIPSKSRVTSTKTRQAVIARPPKSMVVHFNRSLFDEMTGDLKKNSVMVRFPKFLDIAPWALGSSDDAEDVPTEEWKLTPDQPMIASPGRSSRLRGPIYELRAVVTHYGRHENGHYVCYRKYAPPESKDEDEKEKLLEQWWRLSDDDVMKVTEENVLNQGGVFMLFYDCIEPAGPAPPKTTADEVRQVVKPKVACQLHPEEDIPLPVDPGQVVKSVEMQDPALAASIALPDFDDIDLDENNFQDFGNDDSPVHPTKVTKSIELPDLTLPSSIALPDFSDEDLFENGFQDFDPVLTTREESLATGTETDISEYDEDESVDKEKEQEYQPAKAIVVPPYVPQLGVRDENEDPAKGKMLETSSSLVMV
ncbi:related to ubiquitin-specific proteinase UBP1 [Phialocephala subalpina]|uniref:ubiquitinyl hydrolase 1 n=1 Tax=Phialocephala subalpina TaxID=576137 RepID=A0A1L7WW47_9HELO|nr:related to ubiquitin-specific proteinase UBP1 [Phialocephala subalpina]